MRSSKHGPYSRLKQLEEIQWLSTRQIQKIAYGMRDTNPPLWRAMLGFWSTLVVTCLAFNLLKTRIPNYLLFSIAAVISLV
jgi:hypothetical protein